jgi:hypothetical protein
MSRPLDIHGNPIYDPRLDCEVVESDFSSVSTEAEIDEFWSDIRSSIDESNRRYRASLSWIPRLWLGIRSLRYGLRLPKLH